MLIDHSIVHPYVSVVDGGFAFVFSNLHVLVLNLAVLVLYRSSFEALLATDSLCVPCFSKQA